MIDQYTDTAISLTDSATDNRISYLPVALLQVVQGLGVGLLANVGLVNNEVLASSLLSQQHTWVVTSQLQRGHKILSFQWIAHFAITSLFCEVCVK